jgi:hypothetical protein
MLKPAIYILTFSFLLIFSETDAQNRKNYLFRSGIGYSYTHKDQLDAGNGYPSNGLYGEIINDFTVSVNAGRQLKSHFYVGLGFDYSLQKNEINPDGDVPDPDPQSGYQGIYFSFFQSIKKTHTYSPFLYFQYFYSFSEIFSLSLDLYSRYNFSSSETNAFAYELTLPDSTFIPVGEQHTGSEIQSIDLGLSPSIRVKIANDMGIEFTFGQVEFSQKTMDSRFPEDSFLSNRFNIEFKPENWMVGFYIKL